jgi:hypothetical protein
MKSQLKTIDYFFKRLGGPPNMKLNKPVSDFVKLLVISKDMRSENDICGGIVVSPARLITSTRRDFNCDWMEDFICSCSESDLVCILVTRIGTFQHSHAFDSVEGPSIDPSQDDDLLSLIEQTDNETEHSTTELGFFINA